MMRLLLLNFFFFLALEGVEDPTNHHLHQHRAH
jgi:hypothetical protein